MHSRFYFRLALFHNVLLWTFRAQFRLRTDVVVIVEKQQYFYSILKLAAPEGVHVERANLLSNLFLPVWPDLAKFCHFGKIQQSLRHFRYSFDLVFGKLLYLLKKFFMLLGQISYDVNSQRVKNNIAIWSHCFLHSFLEESGKMFKAADVWSALLLHLEWVICHMWTHPLFKTSAEPRALSITPPMGAHTVTRFNKACREYSPTS